jgi:DNA-binding NarL/FixJ family response regulator
MKILLVDDHALFLEGLENLLRARGFDIAGTARDGVQALEQARALRPDVILMDIRMPRQDGITTTRLIKAELPEIQIVMLTTSNEDQDLFEAIRSGASGYLLKSLEGKPFFELLTGLARGEAPLTRDLAARVLKEFAAQAQRPVEAAPQPASPSLTAREQQILSLAAQGMTYKEVGQALNLSDHTIKYHMGEILRLLHLKNREQAIAYARRAGWVKPNE